MTKYWGNPDRCMVCFEEPEVDPTWKGQTRVELVKHHMSYFPEEIAYVHYECHKKIHDVPLHTFIQYQEGDARKFYDMKKDKEELPRWSSGYGGGGSGIANKEQIKR